jgi:hypothetical protein
MALTVIVHFLYGTADKGVRLRAGDGVSASNAAKLREYADCGYAWHGHFKSQYCICFDLVQDYVYDDANPLESVMRTGMFYFKSWMESTVDLSSCKGETSTIVESAKDYI